jgi:lambda family phage portal protein
MSIIATLATALGFQRDRIADGARQAQRTPPTIRTRAYAAATDTRSSSGWTPSGSSANAEVGAGAAAIARRARDAVRNDPYARRIVDLWTGNAVGTGIRTRWPGGKHAGAWKRWAEGVECDAERRLNLYGIQALAMRAVVESGEAFVRIVPAVPTPANPVGLRLQLLEADHLDWSRNGIIDGRTVIQGVEIDGYGAPTAYWLLPRHPGAPWPQPAGLPWSSVRVPATEVLHLFRKDRPGQLRGVSWLAPSLMRLRDLGDYEAALLMKAKIEACLAGIVNNDGEETITDGGDGLVRDANNNVVEAFEPGMILYRRGGGSVDVVNPTGGGSHLAFARRTLEAAGVGSGLTYDQVSGDLTAANYSSLRAGKIEFRRVCEQVQYGMLIAMMVQPVAERFHLQGQMLGLWTGDFPDAIAHVPPAHEMIDPAKDTSALIAQVRAGFVPQAEAVGSFGYDFGDVVAEIAKDNALLDDNGVVVDTDPRRVAKTGGAQDAAQLAAIEIAATGAAAPPAAAPPASQG